RLALRGEMRVDVGDAAAKLLERLVDVDLLLLQGVDALGELLAAVHELGHATVMEPVEIEDLADLGEREPDPAAAQDQDDAGAGARRTAGRRAAARGAVPPFVLEKAKGAGGEENFFGEWENVVGGWGGGRLLSLFRAPPVVAPAPAPPSDNFSV